MLVDQPGMLVAERAGLLVTVMRQAPDDQTFETLSQQLLRALEHQEKLASLTLIPRYAGPSRASRQRQLALANVMRAHAHRHLGAGVVITVPGVRGALIRMVVNGLGLLTTLDPAVSVFSRLEDAVDWVMTLPGPAQDRAQLLAELQALLARG